MNVKKIVTTLLLCINTLTTIQVVGSCWNDFNVSSDAEGKNYPCQGDEYPDDSLCAQHALDTKPQTIHDHTKALQDSLESALQNNATPMTEEQRAAFTKILERFKNRSSALQHNATPTYSITELKKQLQDNGWQSPPESTQQFLLHTTPQPTAPANRLIVFPATKITPPCKAKDNRLNQALQLHTKVTESLTYHQRSPVPAAKKEREEHGEQTIALKQLQTEIKGIIDNLEQGITSSVNLEFLRSRFKEIGIISPLNPPIPPQHKSASVTWLLYPESSDDDIAKLLPTRGLDDTSADSAPLVDSTGNGVLRERKPTARQGSQAKNRSATI